MAPPTLVLRTLFSRFLLIIGCFQLLVTADSETYYIASSTSSPCPGLQPCVPFSQLFSFETRWNSSLSLTLIFLPGNHSLNSELSIEDMSELHVIGNSNYSTTIHCKKLANFSFIGIDLVSINNLRFVGCSGNKVDSVQQFIIEDSMFTGGKVFNTIGAAFELVNTDSVIISSSFIFNGNGSYRGPIGLLQLYKLQAPTSGVDVYAFVGGALIVTRSNVTIISSIFEGNSAQIGGAIFAEKESTMIVSNSSFINNHVSYSHTPYIGGAIYCENSPYNSMNATDTTVFITNTNFIDNLAYTQGGALVTFNSYLTIHSCVFIRNFAAALGGALWIKNARVIIQESHFSHNQFHDLQLQSHAGGVLALDQSIINITSSYFDSNSAWQGGVLYALRQTNITITGSQFLSNTAQAYGGVISVSLQCSVTIVRSQIIDNFVQGQGGVVAADYVSRIVLLDNIVQNNMAYELGGVISIIHSCQILINDSQFYVNAAEIGGVVFSQFSTVFANGSTFYNNSAARFGGVFHTEDNSNISITDNHFEKNTALDGGIVTARGYSTVIIINSILVTATANFGGAVNIIDHCVMLIKGSLFRKCGASELGGAVNVRFLSGLHIQDCIFGSNVAEFDGDSIFVGNHSFVLINRTQFVGCKAQSGGAIHSQTHSLVVLQESELNNSSAILGGAAYTNTGSEMRVKNIQFRNNSARYGGGALHSDTASNVTVEDCAFTENSASWGSTVFVSISVLTVANSNFSRNFADIGTLYLIRCTAYFFGNTEVSYNNGSL